MALEEYKKKRSFEKTPEPKGRVEKGSKDLSFVVQKHDASHLHFDFRLEMDGVLKSWAVPKGPPLKAEKRLAVMVEDHPLEYGKFEGRIPEGNYGAGTVEIWDKGTYKVIGGSLKEGDLKINLYGNKLKGEYALVKFGDEKKNWLMIKKAEKTIATRGKNSQMPHNISPMLAKLADKPFDDKEWIFETKWDGYRAIAEIERGGVQLYSRNDQPFNETYPEVVESLKKNKHEMIVDGEIVALDEKGYSSFQSLQDYKKKKVGITYMVFDLLFLDGRDLRDLPLVERKVLLKEVLKQDDHVKYSDHIEEEGTKLFELAKKNGIEGIMAKMKSSPYVSSRSSNWLKIKNIQTTEAVVGGFTAPRGGRSELGALILGRYEGGKLKYIGHTGGGFGEKGLKEIKEKLESLTTNNSPFDNSFKTNEKPTWVKPKIVVQVKYAELTKDGIMRQPIFQGIRMDKKAVEVMNEQTAVKKKDEIKSKEEYGNLNKIFWPKEKYTKGDVLDYYDQISSTILPYLKDRPESLNRHPDGIKGESFFHKDMKDAPDWVKIVPIHSEGEDKQIHWLICNDKETLLYMANLGCIEINPWNSRYQKAEYPDYLILDLDPHQISFKEVKKVALVVKQVLDDIKVEGFIKTSGITGMHIMLPLGAKYTHDQAKQFTQILAQKVFEQIPDITSLERSPDKRKKKVYLDFLQNRLGQTIASPYCIRPVEGASVSTPLKWEELKTDVEPRDFTIKNIFKRLEKTGDLWSGLLKNKGIDMSKTLERLA